jgi:hypothetical protein
MHRSFESVGLIQRGLYVSVLDNAVPVNLKSECRANAPSGRVLHREVGHFSEVANQELTQIVTKYLG